MPRTGCYELRTECESCGNPVPLNGPLRTVTCTYCLETLSVAPDTYRSLMVDLLEEYDGLAEREGRGGTVLSDRTYKYGYWRLPPRCPTCEKKLDLAGAPEDGSITCDDGHSLITYPAPEWLRAVLPDARRVVGGEREPPGGGAPAPFSPDEAALEPVVMACPQCAGALEITVEVDRVHRCKYCESQVFIPDALWKRLHPVKKVSEWFVVYEDPERPPAPTPSPLEPLAHDESASALAFSGEVTLAPIEAETAIATRPGRNALVVTLVASLIALLLGVAMILVS